MAGADACPASPAWGTRSEIDDAAGLPLEGKAHERLERRQAARVGVDRVGVGRGIVEAGRAERAGLKQEGPVEVGGHEPLHPAELP